VNLLFGLITSSLVGSVVLLALFLLRPITGKIFSKTWHYYCLIVPIVFLLGGTHVAVNLTNLMPYQALVNISPTSTSQEMPVDIPNEFLRPMIFDNLLNIPMGGEGIDAGLAIPSSITSQLMNYFERAVPYLLAFWILGAIIFMVISANKYVQYRRIVLHNTKSVTDTDCKVPIPIVVSETAHTPMLIGVIKPIIVLPNIHFADEELNMILAHEMVHYRRKDLLVKLLMLVANAIHWFNPAVYALNMQLNAICELSCDEKVVLEMNAQNRKLYGETILQVLMYSTAQKNLVGNVAFATNLCNSKKNFKRRLISMMNTRKMRKPIVALALATGLLVVGGGFAISNMIGSVMPVYANEAVENDIGLDLATQVNAPSSFTAQQFTIQQNTSPADIQAKSQENSPIQNQFQWPLYGYASITSPFGMMINPLSGREEFHRGIDISAPSGTSILAAKDGYVTFSGWHEGSGNMVIICHGNGYSTVYAHTSRNLVLADQFVHQGKHIADVGSTGISAGPHLHFEIRINDIAIDPFAYFIADSER